MKKNYWKESCLLLVGIIFGYFISGFTPAKEESIENKIDTIVVRDTIVIKSEIPPLNKHTVLEELKKQNVPHADIVLRQAILESANFKSRLTKTHNNIFGLRKGNKYRKYDNYIACIADYKKLISSKYKGGNYYDFLKRLGYAEDSLYTIKLKNIII